MRHLITVALMVAALLAYAAGLGPLFFGAPVVGSVLVLAALILEVAAWRRVIRHRRRFV